MNRLAIVVALACATPVAAQQVVTYPAGGEQVAPVYINAEVVRVDRAAGTLTFKSESGQTVLTTEGEALGGLGRLRAGDNVILELPRDVRGRPHRDGHPARVRDVGRARTARDGARDRDEHDAHQREDARPHGGHDDAARGGDGRVADRGRDDLRHPGGGDQHADPEHPARGASASRRRCRPRACLRQALTPAQLAANRALGLRNFDAAVAVIAATASQVDRAWAAHRTLCVEGTAPVNALGREWFGVLDGSMPQPTEGQCGQSYAEVARLANQFKAQLDTARETARRSDVLPGDMRESLQRYNVDL